MHDLQKTNGKQPASLWLMGIIYPLITYALGTTNSLLVLYLHRELHFSVHNAYILFAVFNALVFTLPIIGGYLADYFGHREATIVGMVLCVLGLVLPGVHSVLLLKVGLAAFAVGLAVCATTAYCIVDFSYAKQDKRRESGFTLFYMMFNIGFLISSIVGGYIARDFGYHTAFIIAAILVAIALILFVFALPKMKPYEGRSFKGQAGLSLLLNFIILTALLSITVLACFFLLEHLNIANGFMLFLIIASVVGLIVFAMKQKDKISRLKLFAFLALSILSIGFWALYMLEPSLLTVFIAKNVDRTVLGHIIPASSFYSLDSIYIIILGFILSAIWRALAAKDRELSIPTKFTGALFAMGLGYLIFVVGIIFAGQSHLVSVSWILIGYLLLSLAELLISPTGLSMVGRLSPPGSEGTLMGVWQLYVGFSATVSGFLANIAVTPTQGTPATTSPIFAKALCYIAALAIVFGIISALLIPVLTRLSNADKKA